MFKDVRIRKAIFLALNYEELLNASYGDGFWDYTGPLVSGFPNVWTSAEVQRKVGWNPTSPLGAVCGLIVLVVVMVASLAPVVAPFNPTENHQADALVGPNSTYLLGTDEYGRDVLSRVIYGGRVSVLVGLSATAIAVAVALLVGVTTAYLHGPLDYGAQRVVDMVQSMPPLLLLMAMLAAFGASMASLVLVLGLLIGIVMSRVVRGAALAISAQPYIEVARAIGCSPFRVITHHVVPNVLPTVIVLGTMNFGVVIIAEASLSFLGYGVPPLNPSWGGMMSVEGRFYMLQAPWLFLAPTACLGVVVFSVNMLGDARRDKLDPRLRGDF